MPAIFTKSRSAKSIPQNARRGMALVYITVLMVSMVGFCSMAVDLGRVQSAKTALRSAADSSARAAAASLPQGQSAALAEAIAIAADNHVDGSPLVLTSSNIAFGSWNPTTHVFTSGGSYNGTTTYQAVQVTAGRTSANGNAIPLMFGALSACRPAT